MASIYTDDEPRQACPTCRASYPYGVARCAFCGAELPHPPEAATAEPPQVDAEPEQPPPVEVSVSEPQAPPPCAWCGAAHADGAERCPACGAAYLAGGTGEVPALAALQLQLHAARTTAAEQEEGERTASRWRWASWALARAVLRWPGNL
jgi:hypothetical protein